MWSWIQIAEATPGSFTSTCPAPGVSQALYPAEDGEMPPDAELVVYGNIDCGISDTQIAQVGSGPILFTVERLNAQLLRLIPEEPMAVGAWELVDPYTGYSFTFDVVRGAEPPAAPDDVGLTLDVTTHCETVPTLEMDAVVTVGRPGMGLLSVGFRSEDGEQLRNEVLITPDEDTVRVRAEVIGHREACATVTVLSLDGELVDEATACADDLEVCEVDPGADGDSGCGCAAGPWGAGPWGAGLVSIAVAALRRRR